MTEGAGRRLEERVLAYGLALGLAAAVAMEGCIVLLVRGWLPRLVCSGVLWAGLFALLRGLRGAIRAPLQGLTNVVEAYRGGDYTIRGTGGRRGDALGDLVLEINRL